MQLIIHRGTQEIGGSCVELKTDRTRVLIDLGMPLVNKDKKPFDSKLLEKKSIEDLKDLKILPNIRGLYKNEEKDVDAILISHSHLDHYGLLNYVHPDIPIYMSLGAKELIEISSLFTPNKLNELNTKIIDSKKAFSIGDIEVTPYIVDHSAFDALAFLLDAHGKRLFYSGDFRGHGRKSKLFEKIVSNPPKDVDCLLMEGSTLGREEQLYRDEIAVQDRIEQILKAADDITFLFVSSQNIDRIVSAYKACLKTSRIFVIDIYTAYILDRLSSVSKHIPQFDWRNVRIKFYKNQAEILAREVSKKLLYRYNTKKIEMPEINEKKKKVLMLTRYNSMFPRIIKSINNPVGAKIIFSMWEGYLSDKFKEYCAKNNLIIEQVHSSGHANLTDLKSFASAINPRKLIPIHTFEAESYPALFRKIKILKDEEAFTLP